MTSRASMPSLEAMDEVSTLIATLHQTGQRLEELTAGEVDSVTDRDGRTFLLQRAQEELRHSDSAKQAAILNALPAHIALLDRTGRILSVNETWRRFGTPPAIQGPGYSVGLNYLEICDGADGGGSPEAREVAAGVRSVLGGKDGAFSIVYPCHSTTQERWFLLRVTPLAGERPNGAVVMQLDVTAERQAADQLRASERRFSGLLENVEMISMMLDCDGRITFCNDYLLRLTGWRREELMGRNWFDLFVPPELHENKRATFARVIHEPLPAWHHENELLTRSGERRLVRWNTSVLRSRGRRRDRNRRHRGGHHRAEADPTSA